MPTSCIKMDSHSVTIITLTPHKIIKNYSVLFNYIYCRYNTTFTFTFLLMKNERQSKIELKKESGIIATPITTKVLD